MTSSFNTKLHTLFIKDTLAYKLFPAGVNNNLVIFSDYFQALIDLTQCKNQVRILKVLTPRYRVPQNDRVKVYGSEGHKNGANQILILCMFFSTSGHLF